MSFCTFLDRTGHVGAGDTADMQAGSQGRCRTGGGLRGGVASVTMGPGRSNGPLEPVCPFCRPCARRVVAGAPSTPRWSGGGESIRPWADSVSPRPSDRAWDHRRPSVRPMVGGVDGGMGWDDPPSPVMADSFSPGGLRQAFVWYIVYILYSVVCWKEHES